jgi:hypothetical protein
MIDRLLAAIPPAATLERVFWMAPGWGFVLGGVLLMGLLLPRANRNPDAPGNRTRQLARDIQTLVQQRDGYRRQCERLGQELRAARVLAGDRAGDLAVLRVQLALYRKGNAS